MKRYTIFILRLYMSGTTNLCNKLANRLDGREKKKVNLHNNWTK